MAVFTRISLFSNLYFPVKTLRFHVPFRRTQQLRSPQIFSSFSHVSCIKFPFNFPKIPSVKSIFNFPKIPFLTYFPDSWPSNLSVPDEYLGSLLDGPKDGFLRWHFASGPDVNDPNGGIADEEPEVAVVILGWLGAEPHHLMSYVELYNAKGIHAVTFLPSLSEVLVDSNYKMQNLAVELGSWLSNEDGRRRFLLFHTFSNTGWLAYGTILYIWNYQQDLLEKIKGCVVDSGGYPNIESKVWAAGLTTALLKKCSFATDPSIETQTGEEIQNESKIEEKEPSNETKMALALEELFSYLLNLDYMKRRLHEVVVGLLLNQPQCPQLYLYSTEDRAVPFEAVESFIEKQQRIGKQVFSFNFESSPHVDHFGSFPSVYSSQLHNFLKGCLITEGKLLEQG